VERIMATATGSGDARSEAGEVPMVDPRAPRFGQAITAGGLLAGVAVGVPALVFGAAAVLVLAVGTGWRVDVYAVLWRTVVAPRIEPTEPEPAAPHRFARLIGAGGTALSSVLLVAGFPAVGYAVATAIALAAGLAATTGLRLGCRMYRSVSLFQRLDVI
jgi:hypothetical protein